MYVYSMPYKNTRDRRQYHRDLRARHREYVREILKGSVCVDCGYSDWRALDFDHIDPATKFDSVSAMLSQTWKLNRIVDEVSKCAIRCPNCHRIRTYEERHFINQTNSTAID